MNVPNRFHLTPQEEEDQMIADMRHNRSVPMASRRDFVSASHVNSDKEIARADGMNKVVDNLLGHPRRVTPRLRNALNGNFSECEKHSSTPLYSEVTKYITEIGKNNGYAQRILDTLQRGGEVEVPLSPGATAITTALVTESVEYNVMSVMKPVYRAILLNYATMAYEITSPDHANAKYKNRHVWNKANPGKYSHQYSALDDIIDEMNTTRMKQFANENQRSN